MNDDKRILRTVISGGDSGNHPDFMFFCPGCKCGHGVWTTKKNTVNAVWTFNGNMEKPTFTPSLKITQTTHSPPVTPENMDQWKVSPWPQTEITYVCHSVITDGVINFCGDCSHELAGKSIPMEAF